MTDESPRPCEVLLVADDPDTTGAVEDAIDQVSRVDALRIAADADEVIDSLCGQDGAAGAANPNVVLLDWDLSSADADALLTELKGTERIRRVPVIVFANSPSGRERKRAYESHANAVVERPSGPSGFADLIRTIGEFWLGHVRLPAMDDGDRDLG